MDKKKMIKNSPIGYTIPQMKDNDVGLRKFERKFKGSDFVSPLFGYNVKDVVASGKSDIENNVDSLYDVYRRDKKITNQELLAKHGTIYPEFSGVEEHSDANTIAPKPTVKEEVSDLNINFDIKSNNYQETNFNSFVKEEVKEERVTSFANVNFTQPKEDYSVKETNLPPFIEQRSNVVVGEVSEYKEEVNNYQEEVNTNVVEEKVISYSGVVNNTPSVELNNNKKAYVLPPLSLFEEPDRSQKEDTSFLESNKEIINNTLSEFGITGNVTAVTYGPTVSRYEITLAPGINVKKVTSISDNLRMYLSAKTLRIQAPIPGKSAIGIEVPNRKAQMVHFIDLVKDKQFAESNDPLKIVLGKDIDNNTVYQDIAKMPHGLVAGATSSGKSVCINTLLISLLLKNTPDDLRLILVDPKFVELSTYNDIPHLITPVIIDAKMASKALKWAVDEMEKRYVQLMEVSARNIEEYNKGINKHGRGKMPFIVVVIDELADLMNNCGAEVEDSIQRLAQKARAAGIHLILATQRPTTDVVKGTIKANVPVRIAFKVAQTVDSVTMIDQGGAENLLGYGDMLIKSNDGVERVQGAYIKGSDIDRITDFIRENNDTNYAFSHEHLKTTDIKQASNDNDDLELLYSAALFFIQKQTCSINGLQTQFNLGFNRAQKVVDQLEKYNIVSPKNNTLAREVLVTADQLAEIFNK